MKIYPYITDEQGNMPITMNLYSHDEGEHKHDYIELVYILSGSGIHYINDVPYHLMHGNALFIDIGEVHRYTVIDNMSYINFKIRPEYFSARLSGKTSIRDIYTLPEFKSLPPLGENHLAYFDGHLRLRVEQLLFSMLEENLNRLNGFEAIIKNNVINFLIQTNRNIVTEKNVRRDAVSLPDKLKKGIDYIDEHSSEKITLKSISKMCNYSEVYFSKLLKTYYGCGFSDYLMKKRIANAMNLLIETQIPVQEIAIRSGFNNKTHFYKTFHKYIGVKPAFIRTYKQDSSSFVHSAINKSINAFYEYDAENSHEE